MSMQSTDPIADMLTRIRNAINVSKSEVRLPHSKLKETIAVQLKKAGYLHAVSTEPGKPRPTLIITINKPGANATITEISRVSTPGRRAYAGVSDIPRIKSGRGIVLISTSQGIMTGAQAKRAKLGGELICKVY
ncbi:MAG TPA: 30S ribosomal protein S8 [Candidatus Saccharimonadales bacterium]|jgi:small subunit ribosomal protein S8|nr:30S ribosomal protein S8 [Candidatus Saccharimonadales bacterium]